MIKSIIDFFNHPLFVCVGGLTTLLAVVGLLWTTVLIARGLLPIWIRLGMGLAKRKIAILAKEEADDLSDILVDSRLFNAENIMQVGAQSIKKAESATIILVHWKPFEAKIDEILEVKRDSDALVIYAPQHEGPIPDEDMARLAAQRHTIIVNFRGRLLNEIYTTMITTSYEKG